MGNQVLSMSAFEVCLYFELAFLTLRQMSVFYGQS